MVFNQLNKEQAKEKIKELVQEFLNYNKNELDNKSENQIKSEFIDPLFEALGWDMRKNAEREERVLKGRADYIIKERNKNFFVIEAKRTNIRLNEEEGRQTVSYAYHRKIKFAVLTNFREIKIFHALSNIKDINKNLLKDSKGYLTIKCEEFENQFDRLWYLSKESIDSGELNKLLTSKDEKLFKPIDKNILDDLINIREWLSKELKSKKNYLEKEKIDEIVQILIDRLIFIRSVEDRGLEPKDYLIKIIDDVKTQRVRLQLFPYLMDTFKSFNAKYDSKLFEEGILEKEGAFSDEVLFKTIKGLYFGTESSNHERYMFDQIPGDLLGEIYEQYLGYILEGTEKRVKLEEGKGKRKSMGIYYTPHYIVEYIIKNTIGEYSKNKNIDELLRMRIIDPACGSGSFIVSAFQEMCYMIEDRLKKNEFSKEWTSFKSYDGRLMLSQKISILKSCIYGVDLDEKAIELARLNLLLKLLEDEGQDTKKLVLPHLENNIKCGNSLIDDSSISEKAFNWHAQFKEVFAQGGFDIIVGNPPYGADLSEKDRELLDNKFNIGNTDTACLFMQFAKDLLKEGGINGFIIPKPFVYSSTWTKIRESLLDGLIEIVDCGKVWKEVKLEQVIYIFDKGKKINSYRSCVRKDQEIICVGEINKETFKEFGFLLNGISDVELKIGRKIKNAGISLNEFVINQRGGMYQKKIIDKPSDFKVLGGAQIGRYIIHNEIKGYIPKKIIKEDNGYIKENSILVQNIVAHIENPIDHIKITAALPKNLKDFIILDTINQLQNNGQFSSEYIIAIINSKLINWYIYRFIFGKAIRTMHFDNGVTERLPITRINLKNKEEKVVHDKIVNLVNNMQDLQQKYNKENNIGNEKENLQQQIKNIDYEIDELVYKLYGITEEEKKIIEASL